MLLLLIFLAVIGALCTIAFFITLLNTVRACKRHGRQLNELNYKDFEYSEFKEDATERLRRIESNLGMDSAKTPE